MATNFPGSLDSFTNPSSSSTLDSPSHAAQHANINDAVEAVQAKLGTGAGTIGTWTTFTPTWTFGANAITTTVFNYGRYLIINDYIVVKCGFRYSSKAGSGSLTLTIPAAAGITPLYNYDRIGYGNAYDAGVGLTYGMSPYHINLSETEFLFLYTSGGGTVTDTSPFAFNVTDEVFVTLIGVKS